MMEYNLYLNGLLYKQLDTFKKAMMWLRFLKARHPNSNLSIFRATDNIMLVSTKKAVA